MACPSVGLSTSPTLSRFLYYKINTLVPVTATPRSGLRWGAAGQGTA